MAHDDIAALGRCSRELAPSKTNLVAGVILGLLMICGGIALVCFVANQVIKVGGKLPWYAKRGWSWGPIIIFGVGGIALVAGGVMLLAWIRRDWSLTVGVCEHGFFVRTRRNCRVFTWDRITSVHETVLHERVPLVKGPTKFLMPASKSKSYLIRRNDGEEFSAHVNNLTEVGFLASVLRVEAQRRGIPWEVEEVRG